jgi:DNA-binding PadR family transcriptional regulator
MQAGDPLGQVEFAVLDAVHRGALRSRRTAGQVRALGERPAGEAILHNALRRCERGGLLRSDRDELGRRYELTAAGRARLRTDRRFKLALIGVLLRSQPSPSAAGPESASAARGF